MHRRITATVRAELLHLRNQPCARQQHFGVLRAFGGREEGRTPACELSGPKNGLAVLQHSLQRFEPTLQAEDLRVLGVELLLKTLDGGQRDTAFVHRRN